MADVSEGIAPGRSRGAGAVYFIALAVVILVAGWLILQAIDTESGPGEATVTGEVEGLPDETVAESGEAPEAEEKTVLEILETDDVRVPDVTGRSRESAESALDAFDLVVVVQETLHPDVPEGNVSSQSPEGGTSVRPGARVTLTVSLGPPATVMVSVPGVVGMSEAAARSDVEAKGFEVYVLDRRADTGAAGVVVDQWPAAGDEAPGGSRVILTIEDA